MAASTKGNLLRDGQIHLESFGKRKTFTIACLVFPLITGKECHPGGTTSSWNSILYPIALPFIVLLADAVIDKHVLPVFTTYHHLPILLFAYLAFTKYFGPRFMNGRKPFELKGFVMVYNVFQIGFNIYIIGLCCTLMGKRILDPWGHVCSPVTSANQDVHVKEKIMVTLYYYYLNKLLDAMETVFFVLRKKQSQVSFLHVYHHVIMIYSSWISSLWLMDELLIQFVFLNTMIHVVMYIYYFLSSLGPSVQKYLWWKKYITKMQIGQFCLALSMIAKSKLDGCKYNDSFYYLWTFNISTILALFVHFYIKTYLNKQKVK